MLKYENVGIVFQEIPDEVTLSINISNCPCRCPGCHSKYLWENIGNPLDKDAIDKFMESYRSSITCVCFMGGDAEPQSVDRLAAYVKEAYPEIHTGWYSGRTVISAEVNRENFDYIKIGPYLKHLGGLNKRTTNQRLYKIERHNLRMIDITSQFWKK